MTLASSAPEPTNTAPIPITATFSEAVSGFASGDVSVTNGSVTGFTGGPSVYTFGIDPTADGLVTVDIAANVAQDAAGNDNTAAPAVLTRTYDTTSPGVTLASSAPEPTNTAPIPITATFSEAVSGFASGDVSVTNGSVTGFTGGPSVYTFGIDPTADGLVTVDIAANVAQDAAGNDNTAAPAVLTRTYDTTSPGVTLASSAPEPTNTAPIPITATFSEAVSGFASGDVSVTNGSVTGFAGGPSVYTFGIDPTADGLVTVDIAANVAQDAAGNDNTAAPAVLTRTYDATSPGVTLASSAPEPTNTAPIPITATFSEAVSGFASGDVSVTNGSVTGFAGGPSVYTFGIDPTADGLVTVDIAANVAQDAAGNDNNAAAQFSITFDGSNPTVTITSSASPGPTFVSPIPITVTFSEDVTGFTTLDLSLSNGTDSNFTVVSGSVYTFDLASIANGLATVDIGADSAFDAAGNGNTAATQFTITFSVNFAPESDGAGAVNGGTATNDVADAETVREDNADPTGLTVD